MLSVSPPAQGRHHWDDLSHSSHHLSYAQANKNPNIITNTQSNNKIIHETVLYLKTSTLQACQYDYYSTMQISVLMQFTLSLSSMTPSSICSTCWRNSFLFVSVLIALQQETSIHMIISVMSTMHGTHAQKLTFTCTRGLTIKLLTVTYISNFSWMLFKIPT